MIGTYASIGVDPPTAANTAEFFVLYRCPTDGTQEFLYSCYGDYGGCPKTAATAVRMDPTIAVSPSPAAAGSTVTVSGNCFGSLAVVALGATADASDTFATSPNLTPVQGAYLTTFTLPADAPSSVVATSTCGDPDVVTGTASTTFSITAAPTTTTTAVTPTTAAPATPAAAVQTPAHVHGLARARR